MGPGQVKMLKCYENSVLTEIQLFLLNKHSPGCGKPLVDSQSFEKKEILTTFVSFFLLLLFGVFFAFNGGANFKRWLTPPFSSTCFLKQI